MWDWDDHAPLSVLVVLEFMSAGVGATAVAAARVQQQQQQQRRLVPRWDPERMEMYDCAADYGLSWCSWQTLTVVVQSGQLSAAVASDRWCAVGMITEMSCGDAVVLLLHLACMCVVLAAWA